jgi:alpha-glucan,water dikinase
VFTWLRMSSSKILTWARRSNYQSKDIAWMQKVTSERMTEKVGAGMIWIEGFCIP